MSKFQQFLSPTCGRGNIASMTESNTSPVVPVRASTLILVRGEGEKFEVYLLKRSSQSGFMPGHYVFPGGVVDPEDRNFDFWQGHIDLDRAQVMTRFGGGLNDEGVLSHGIAAIRETFEEAGVWDPHYHDQEIQAEIKGLGKRAAPLGRPFSRIWYSEGIWRPISP